MNTYLKIHKNKKPKKILLADKYVNYILTKKLNYYINLPDFIISLDRKVYYNIKKKRT